MKRIFLTAGFGKIDFHLASHRLSTQVSDLGIFDSIVCVDEDILKQIYPSLFNTYTEEELLLSKGFGYYSWQSVLVNAALEGFWGDFDIVVYMDAGCEVLPGRRTKRAFNDLFKKALDTGCSAFAIDTPELQYSKSAVVSLFSALPSWRLENQIQTGTLTFSSSQNGRSLAREWSQIVISNPVFTNDVLDRECDNFVAHRHAQSIFSLLFKTHGFIEESIIIPFPRSSILSKLRAVRYPIWWARNISGRTVVPWFVRILARALP
jgi:hypothetical protein